MKNWLKMLLFALLILALTAACTAFAEDPAGQLIGDELQSDSEPVRVEGYSFTVSASSITYGMHLYDSVLDASGSTVTLDGQTVPAESVGSFLWRNRMQVPEVGESSYSVYFVPNENLGAAFEDVQVTVRVNKARPVIAQMPSASPLQYGQSLNQSVLSGGSAINPHHGDMEPVQGVFEWEIRDLVPSVGSQQATVVFTPIINAADRYETVYFSVPVEVRKLTAEIANTPVPSRALKYGETLSAVSLTGGSAVDEFGQNVPGNFVFEKDEVLPVGTHTVSALFMPLDHVHRESVRFSVQVTVEKAPLTVTAESAKITYGQTLGDAVLQGAATDARGNFVEGKLAFKDGGRKPAVNESGAFEAVFTPADQENYETAKCTVQVEVHKAQLFLRWNDNMKYAGMQDGSYAYSVPGLPEGAVLQGSVYRDAGENAGTYVLHADKLALPADLAENYILIKENGTFRIEQIAFSVSASVAGEKNEKGWYTSAAQLQAPAGYAISFSRGGEYHKTLMLPESASGAEYYIRAEQGEYAGAVGGPFRADYKLDKTLPDIELTVLDGNEFILTGYDAISGVDRIYGLFAGTAQYYQGAAEAEYAYAARETGNYTYVVHDMAGHTAAVTVDFPDTDGDGLVDAYEVRTGTAIDAADTDKDGIGDYDARVIRNLLGFERMHVSGAALLGVMTDHGERAASLPDADAGLLVRDDSFAPRAMSRTFRGVMRVNEAGSYGFYGDLMWYMDREDVYTVLHTEKLSGSFALSVHAPGGLLALADYENGKTLSPIFLADMTCGKVYAVSGTEGAERFDLSPDGKYLAYLKDGAAGLVDVETGNLLLEAPLETEYVFQFDGQGLLVTDGGYAEAEAGAWKMVGEMESAGALYLEQCVRGEACVRVYSAEDAQYLLRVAGSAALEDGENVRTLKAALVKMDASLTMEEQLAELENMSLDEKVTVSTELFAKDE